MTSGKATEPGRATRRGQSTDHVWGKKRKRFTPERATEPERRGGVQGTDDVWGTEQELDGAASAWWSRANGAEGAIESWSNRSESSMAV